MKPWWYYTSIYGSVCVITGSLSYMTTQWIILSVMVGCACASMTMIFNSDIHYD